MTRISKLAVVSFVLVFGVSQTASAQSGPSKGTLVLEGGAAMPVPEVAQRFGALAGGANGHVVLVPTAADDGLITPEALKRITESLKQLFGVQDLVVVHTRDRKTADSEEFVASLKRATGIWFSGGKAGQLVEPYLGTRTQREFDAILQRGGVIGGDSAGAMVMGTLLLHGATTSGSTQIIVPGRDHGFGFLKNVAVNAHVVQRSEEEQLAAVVGENPTVLGIGLDAKAGIVVTGDEFEVTGRSIVLVTDGKSHNGASYLELIPGDRYNMKTRVATLLPPEKRREVEARPEITHRGPAVSRELEGDWQASVEPPDGPALQYILHVKNLPEHTVLAKLQVIEPTSKRSGPTITFSNIKQDGRQVEFIAWGGEMTQPLIKGTLNQDGTEISGFLIARTQVPLTLKKIKATPAPGR
ncbi:MAG TPA: cyanophycinase [Candidatus Angelobacter sp.]|jgi:cyanophycinase|nr:cyanophycinase [Candidatus Angelobacter sp.]